MNQRYHPLFWSFGLGTWAGVRVRVSWFFPLLVFWLVYKFEVLLGLSISATLFLSVLFHEIGHILAARSGNHSGDEIIIWPLGGLAMVGPAATARAQIKTALAGPLVNLVLCSVTLYAVLRSSYSAAAFNPLVLPFPKDKFGLHLASDIQVLAFNLNWMLLLVNLIPAYPFDGGRALRAILSEKLGGAIGMEAGIRVAFVAAVGLGLSAFFVDHLVLMALAALVAIVALQETHQLQAADSYDDSFMGYDFSQGYTSLERSEQKEQDPRPGLLQRWLERRRNEKRRRQEQLDQEAESQLDALLAKVHEHGVNALTESEKRMLKRASDRYRKDKDS